MRRRLLTTAAPQPHDVERDRRACAGIALVAICALAAACSSDGSSDQGGSGAGNGSGGSAAQAGHGGESAGGAGGSSSGSGGSSSGSGGSSSGSGGSSSGSGGSGGSSSGSGGGGTAGGSAVAPYVVSIDHDASPTALLKIDVQSGAGTVACTLPGSVDTINYHSSTFSRQGTLFASNYQNGTLDIVDPCTCSVTEVGATGYGSIPGITADYALGLFGIETSNDLLLALDPATALGSTVGALGVDFSTSGATWSDTLDGGNGGLYAINGSTNQLYTVDRDTGAATPVVGISGVTFGSVGIELHPASGVIYACTGDAVLYSIDPGSGQATAIGSGMGHLAGCNNLAAPWTAVPCLDSL